MESKRGFRVSEAVQYTGRSRSAVYVAIREGQLTSYKVGKQRLMLREDLDAWLERQTTKAPEPPETA